MIEIDTQEKPIFSNSEEFKVFIASFNQTQDPVEQIRNAIAFMRSRLSNLSSPKFREFWEARKLCLPLFKTSLPVKERAELWEQYVELSLDARRLKEVLDEQSAFAYEQIDLAVVALMRDLDSYQEVLEQIAEIPFLQEAKTLESKLPFYKKVQKELQLLNAFAGRVNALRKEVMKTDMRIRNKDKLFEKLSACGDKIFPQRKEFIKEISEKFLEDVSAFAQEYFSANPSQDIPLHFLREEIKVLQNIAKTLTLNTHSFTQTRLHLSKCWDLLKEKEKEKKKEFLERKAQMQESLDKAEGIVKAFEELCIGTQDLVLVEKQHRDSLQALRGLDLGRPDLQSIKDRLDLAKKPIEDKKRSQVEEKQERERKQEEARFKKVQEFREELEACIQDVGQISEEELTLKKGGFEERLRALPASKAEKSYLERVVKQLKDKILEMKGRSLLALSGEDQELYEQLQQLLQDKKLRRSEIKLQIEVYRKALGGSNLDFEKAMHYRELMDVEKESLDKMHKDIEEIEAKIEQLES